MWADSGAAVLTFSSILIELLTYLLLAIIIAFTDGFISGGMVSRLFGAFLQLNSVTILLPFCVILCSMVYNHLTSFTDGKHTLPRRVNTLGKRVYVYSVTWVRIPLSPHQILNVGS